MAIRNYLIEGVSGTGKTSVATLLEGRGFLVIHGDRKLAYQGDPETGARFAPEQCSDDPAFINSHHIWDVAQVEAILDDRSHDMAFFCGASRNRQQFAHRFDIIFLLEADWSTIAARLNRRVDEWGSRPEERALVERLHTSRVDLPDNAVAIDATQPLPAVVDAILAQC